MTGMASTALIASRVGSGTATNNDSAPLWESGGTVGQEYGRSNTERYIDNTLNVIESDGFGYTAMAGGLGYAAYTCGAAASAAGTSVTAGALAAAAPVAVASVAGIVGGVAGAWVGDKLGHAVMGNHIQVCGPPWARWR